MEIIRTTAALRERVERAREEGLTVGLVPTMGALHAGHLSLVERAVAENGFSVVSVFVNPTQFNNPTDLATYPRHEEEDFLLLEKAGVDAVFAPSVEEMYADGTEREKDYDLGPVAEVMEGKYRPGHFQGVAQVVDRLFTLANPHRAYFGEKDFQQIAVIRRMVAETGHKVEIVPCPIKRAPDGLALSSRNALLTPGQLATAPGIHRILLESTRLSDDLPASRIHDYVVTEVNSLPECEVEYFEIVDADSLQPIGENAPRKGAVGCITVYCGKVRLIDNIKY